MISARRAIRRGTRLPYAARTWLTRTYQDIPGLSCAELHVMYLRAVFGGERPTWPAVTYQAVRNHLRRRGL